jgi:molybdopterin-biosynthesis enzyme MoeA-like protein
MHNRRGVMKKIGLIIIGDEILSGRRTDAILPRVIAMLAQRGLVLSWVKIIGDDKALLDSTFKQSFADEDIVFSSGGIGATPDDMTREAAARAVGVTTERHPEGAQILETLAREHNRPLTEQLYRLVEFPSGAALIPNSVNTIPGFSVGDHHFVPGFPDMACAMIEWVLDNRYRELHNSQYREVAILVNGQFENEMIPLMEEIERRHPDIKMFCLPTMEGDMPVNEIGLKGQSLAVGKALDNLTALLNLRKFQWQQLD